MSIQETQSPPAPHQLRFQYRAYGLGIESNFELAELDSRPGPVEVTIRQRLTTPPHDPAGQQGFLRFDREEITYVCQPVGVFRLSAGRMIEFWLTPGVEQDFVRYFLIGNLMAMLLHQRGRLVLHASCVGVGEQGAIAFVGQSGAGKSTIAAAFDAAGHPIISDDIAAVDLERGLEVPTGYSFFKIAPAAADALGFDAAQLTYLHTHEPHKKGLVIRNQAEADRPRRLLGIFLLAIGEADELAPVPAREALLALLQHTFPTRLNQRDDGQQLRQLAALVGRVSIYQFQRPPGLDKLDLQVERILSIVRPEQRHQ